MKKQQWNSPKNVLVSADTLSRFGTEPNLIENQTANLRQRMSNILHNADENEDDDIEDGEKLSLE